MTKTWTAFLLAWLVIQAVAPAQERPSIEVFRQATANLGQELVEDRQAARGRLNGWRDRYPLFFLEQAAVVYVGSADVEIRKSLEELLRPVVRSQFYDRPFGFIGINMSLKSIPRNWAIEQSQAIVVQGVVEGFPGKAAGLAVGDWILEVDGVSVDALESLQNFIVYISELPPGMEVELLIRRGEEERVMSLILGERPEVNQSFSGKWNQAPEAYFDAWLEKLPMGNVAADPDFPVGHFD